MKQLKYFLERCYTHRFGPVAILIVASCTISFITRLLLLFHSLPNLDFNPVHWALIFLIGLFYDLVVGFYAAIPLVLYCWLMPSGIYNKYRHKFILYGIFGFAFFFLLFNASAEWFFWGEFNVRYNFIAVDYLIYTTEVIGNIRQSYSILPYLLITLLILSLTLVWVFRHKIKSSQQYPLPFLKRTLFSFLLLAVPVCSWFLVNNSFKNFSSNNYIRELSGNGLYEFGAAFWNNELDYNKFYVTEKNETAFKKLRETIIQPGEYFTSIQPFVIDRKVMPTSSERKMNVVLISVESLSGSFMKYFGNTQNITPVLDSLIPHSLFFSNFYASGTRTVKGLEALSLALPPTPGQAIIRRPHNEDLFTIGSIFKNKKYDVKFIYGGNSFFDNMGYFFLHNDYQVIDRANFPKNAVHFETAWGVADEDLFTKALKEMDKSYDAGKLFFNHIMTVSNHRPYTFPQGRIDRNPDEQTREGVVKYSDYCIGKFLNEAKIKPWFSNTIFVIVADHCAKVAGKTEIPVNDYHIPCLIYCPSFIVPKIDTDLAAQIDLAPTLLGLLNISYNSKFLGADISKSGTKKDRIFLSTYQKIAYVKDHKMVVLSPVKQAEMFSVNFNDGSSQKIPMETPIVEEAIAYYQTASYLFKNKLYKK
ncbi:MAG TPA: LTA synthase family protein [Chitinophagaceae bacterium]|nr:LTA synthase family protein [Chitinophagaceae bacterium]